MAPKEEYDDPQNWWRNLDWCDPSASQRLLRLLMPEALRLLREGFGLIELHGKDEAAAEAALLSAWSSFQRHNRDRDFKQIRDPEVLAVDFIRITYNRWQRADDQRQKMSRAVKAGILRDGSGQERARDYEDSCPGPAEAVAADDFTAYFKQVIESVKAELSAKRLRTVQAWLQDLYTSRHRSHVELAQELAVHQTTVSRHLTDFCDRVCTLLKKSGAT